MAELRKTRPISWLKAALRDFERFPASAQNICLVALTVAAEGGKADIAQPMVGLGSGVFEIALPFQGNAFQKKSTKGIATPRHEIELVKQRLRVLKEMLS